MLVIKKFIPSLFFTLILGLVIWQVEPPQSLTQASFPQLTLFFIPLLLFLIFLINFYTKFLLKSFILSLGLTILLVLKALDLFIFLSLPAVLVITLFIAKSLEKPARKSFSSKPKIPPKPHWLNLPEVTPETSLKKPRLSRIKNS